MRPALEAATAAAAMAGGQADRQTGRPTEHGAFSARGAGLESPTGSARPALQLAFFLWGALETGSVLVSSGGGRVARVVTSRHVVTGSRRRSRESRTRVVESSSRGFVPAQRY